jgi:hypothetical protein
MQILIWIIEYDCAEGPALKVQAHEYKNNHWSASAEPWFFKTDNASLKRLKSKWQYAKFPEFVFIFSATENTTNTIKKTNLVLQKKAHVLISKPHINTEKNETIEQAYIPIANDELAAYESLKKLGCDVWLAVRSSHNEKIYFNPAVFIKPGNKTLLDFTAIKKINTRQIIINTIVFLFLFFIQPNKELEIIHSKLINTHHVSNQWYDEALQLCKKLQH